MSFTYTVQTEKFQGPLELLLDLIEERKLSINEISLASVTDDFIAFVNGNADITVAERSHFVLIASTLLLIKSKALLPSLELTEEEAESVHDLERRLALYKRFRELSLRLGKMYGARRLYTPAHEREEEIVFSPHQSVSVSSLHGAARALLQSLPVKERIPQAVVDKMVSLEEMIETLTERVSKSISTSFRELSGMGKREKTHVIVSFLALLELVKQDIISAAQEKRFEDITVESKKVATPRYS